MIAQRALQVFLMLILQPSLMCVKYQPNFFPFRVCAFFSFSCAAIYVSILDQAVYHRHTRFQSSFDRVSSSKKIITSFVLQLVFGCPMAEYGKITQHAFVSLLLA